MPATFSHIYYCGLLLLVLHLRNRLKNYANCARARVEILFQKCCKTAGIKFNSCQEVIPVLRENVMNKRSNTRAIKKRRLVNGACKIWEGICVPIIFQTGANTFISINFPNQNQLALITTKGLSHQKSSSLIRTSTVCYDSPQASHLIFISTAPRGNYIYAKDTAKGLPSKNISL